MCEQIKDQIIILYAPKITDVGRERERRERRLSFLGTPERLSTTVEISYI